MSGIEPTEVLWNQAPCKLRPPISLPSHIRLVKIRISTGFEFSKCSSVEMCPCFSQRMYINNIYWWYTVLYLLNFFAALVVSYWFSGWTLDSYWSIVLALNVFQNYLRAGEKWRIFCRPSNRYCRFTETFWSEVENLSKIVLECVRRDFEKTSNINNFSNMFYLNRRKKRQ